MAPSRLTVRTSVTLPAMVRVLLLLAALGGLARANSSDTVVLPFSNLSGSANLDWIGESIAETVRQALAAEGIPVLDRETRDEAMRRLSLRPSAPLALGSVVKLGRLLEVRRVVYGSFELSPAPGDGPPAEDATLRLSARVLDLGEVRQSDPWTATGPLKQLADVQGRLAWQALRRFLPESAVPSEEQFRAKHRPVRLDALESYIRGLMAGSAEQKHRLLTQAVRLDEGFTAPFLELGRLLYQGEKYQAAAGWLEKVPPDSPDILEATFLLGLCRYHLAEFEKAESAFALLAGLLPLPEVWNNLGASLSRLGKAEAVDQFRRAAQAEPNDPVYRFNLGYALWKQQAYAEAAEEFRAVLNLTPDDAQATLMLGRCLNQTRPSGVAMKMENLERIKTELGSDQFRRPRPAAAKGTRGAPAAAPAPTPMP